MDEVCINIKTELQSDHNGLTALAQLVAIYTSAGIISATEIAAKTGYSERGVRKAMAELRCRNQGATEPGCRNPGAESGTPVPSPNPGAGTQVPKVEALVCADNTTRATKESFQDTPSLEGRKNPPTPQGGTGDDLHRKAYIAGIELKGGKVAKSARSTQRTVGELDGSNGITFADGELTVDAATAAKIRAKFPGVDVVAVCNKAAPEVGRTGYPTRDFAAAVIGKWAQIQIENKRSAPASKGEIVPFKVTGVRHARPRDEVANA